MTIDWTKPIETMDGCPARVIATDIKGDCRFALAVTKESLPWEIVIQTDENGADWAQKPVVRNVPPAPVVRYFNVYSDCRVGVGHNTRKKADYNAMPDRIACVRVEFKEGQFDE